MDPKYLSQLVRDSQAGDPQAKEQLVQAIQHYIYFYCRTMLHSEDAAMDASQDILLAVIKKLDTLRNPDAFLGWLRQIILRTCQKQMARAKRERQHLLTDLLPGEGSLSSQLTPDELLDREETRRIVMELVEALPLKQRLCVLLYYYDEMSVEDIASSLHLSVGTVKSRLHYARMAIKHGAEKYAGKGFPFYGLSPLPFLSYFLQQEASCCIGAAAAAGLTQAVLTGGAAAGGATAVGVVIKSMLTALAGKKAIVLAALALAGTVTGGVLHQTTQNAQLKTPEPPPAPSLLEPPSVPVLETTVRPALQSSKAMPLVQPEEMPEPLTLPEAPELWLPSLELDLAPEPEPDAIPVPDLDLVLPELAPPAWEPDFSFPVVEWPQPITPTAPEPEESVPEEPPLAEPTPVAPVPEEPRPAEPTPVAPVPEVPRPAEPTPVAPVPEEPRPVEPPPVNPTPEEPEPVPEETVISRTFVDEAGNGGYGYTYTFANVWQDGLPEGPLTYESSDPTVVSVNEKGEFSTLAPGSAVLAAVAEDGSRYELNFTVENCFRWQFSLPDEEIVMGDVARCGFQNCLISLLSGYQGDIKGIEWTSSDPSVAEIGQGYYARCDVYARSTGTAVITAKVTFLVDTTDGTKEMEDTCSFQVTVTEAPEPEEPAPPEPEIPDSPEIPGEPEIPEEPEESETPEEPEEPEDAGAYRKDLTEFGVSSGYGYTSLFMLMWGDGVSWNLTGYSSSDPSVVDINAIGRFSTLSAGTADLRAVDPNDPEHPYIMTVHVENHLDIGTIHDVVIWAGSPQLHGLENKEVYSKTFVSVTWESSDPSVVTVTDSGEWSDCFVTGVAPGEASVTGRYVFDVDTINGTIQMSDTLSFQVTVIE